MTPGVTAPPVPYWLAKSMLNPDDRVEFWIPQKNGKPKFFWRSNAGPQTWLLRCPCDEILAGGSRGGGKSIGLIAWLASGDLNLPETDPARASFLNDPTYRAVILRDQYQNLVEFVEEAYEFYRGLLGTAGVKATGNPVVLDFPKSGAKIYTNHLGTEEAYNKYRGWNITRIGIEEVTQIPKEGQYLKLFGSLRSKPRFRNGQELPRLRTQICSTTNPDGPGAYWVRARFLEKRNKAGEIIPPNTLMEDPITGLRRIFIPMKLTHNPFLASDAHYRGMLLSQDAVTRAQWIDGDWYAAKGRFFKDYRPKGPVGQEEADKYPWARHIVSAVPLQPWWFRFGSGDLGYDHPAAFHKFCRNENDKRVHAYDELSLRGVGAYELGVIVARWWRPELEQLPDHQITLYFSPEAFNKENSTRTLAEQFALGINEELGPYGSLVLRYNDEERALAEKNPKMAAALFERRRSEAAEHMCIIVKQGSRDRKGRFSYMRDMLRFRPALEDAKPDETHARLLLEHHGLAAYTAYINKFHRTEREVLPKLLIWNVCKGLDRCIQSAVHDEGPKSEEPLKWDAENGKNGDDELDSASYGLAGYEEVQTTMPRTYWVRERISEFQEQYAAAHGEELTDPTRLAMVSMRQNQLYNGTHPPSGGMLSLPRQSAPRRVQ